MKILVQFILIIFSLICSVAKSETVDFKLQQDTCGLGSRIPHVIKNVEVNIENSGKTWSLVGLPSIINISQFEYGQMITKYDNKMIGAKAQYLGDMYGTSVIVANHSTREYGVLLSVKFISGGHCGVHYMGNISKDSLPEVLR